MIYFDQETRQFSIFTKTPVKNVGNLVADNAGKLGMAGGVGTIMYLRRKEEEKLQQQGMTPDKARKQAKKKYGGKVGAAIKGGILAKGTAMAGRAVSRAIFK